MAEKSFETAMKRLEEIVALLEAGEQPLEKSIKLFEEGSELAKYCEKKLAQFDQKIIEFQAQEPKEG